MPRYMGECGSCGHVGEYYFGSGDPKVCGCHECGTKFNLDGNRRYDLEGLQIQGETCPGGTNYHYYDPHLGRQIHGKRDRAYEMERQGLREYSPVPELQRHRDEAAYITKNADPKDRAAATAAARKELKTAETKRRMGIINERFDKAAKKLEGA